MDQATVLQEVHSWPLEEQLDFVFRAWDQLVNAGWHPELTSELKADLDRRLAAHAADPTDVVSWEQLVAKARRQ